MLLPTGGVPFGEISTRSSPMRAAMSRAASVGMTPSCCPSSFTTRTSGTRIARFTRTLSFSGATSRQRRLRNPTRSDLLLDVFLELLERHHFLGRALSASDADAARGLFALAHDERERNLLFLRGSHAVVECLAAQIRLRADAGAEQQLRDLASIHRLAIRYRQHADLQRREEHREVAAGVLEVDGDEALQRAQHRSV